MDTAPYRSCQAARFKPVFVPRTGFLALSNVKLYVLIGMKQIMNPLAVVSVRPGVLFCTTGRIDCWRTKWSLMDSKSHTAPRMVAKDGLKRMREQLFHVRSASLSVLLECHVTR
eukprot:scaffold266643_cov56-Prasinocladus_malaysianus.AAC.1